METNDEYLTHARELWTEPKTAGQVSPTPGDAAPAAEGPADDYAAAWNDAK